ncbi:DUF4270 domain-containing protein [Corallibacter sp.]|uniref:DUF4270 domain-containing protein n=1 Tax=Corallibacter sp. TaxID=2038084 RepID=UPI003AB76940
MKKKENHILKSISLLLLIAITCIACERDFSSVESDLEGYKNFNTNSMQFPIVAYNKKTGPVQTNNLSSNLLGVYNDPVYGQTTASIVSQVVPTTYSPDFGEDPEIVDVILTVPYFVTNLNTTDENGLAMYNIDSLYGSSPIKLTIRENTYFLRDNNPNNLDESQKYYSNAGQALNIDNEDGEEFFVNGQFFPNNSEIVVTEYNEDTGEDEEVERITPSLQVSLFNSTDNEAFWNDLFFSQEGTSAFSNANNFKDYFRGLLLKAEAVSESGNMVMLDLTNASIVVTYSNPNDAGTARINSEYNLIFSGNKLNIFENDPSNTIINQADANANSTTGDENLYIKGGEGSMAVIDLFNGQMLDEDGNPVDSKEYFLSKKEDWLINEANLVFYVNQDIVNQEEPDRVTLYDLTNKEAIIDYSYDTSTNTALPLYSKINFSKILERDSNNNGVKYKIQVTEHLNNILLRDSLNLKLGLFVTTNINGETNSATLNSEDDFVPTTTVLSPRGTVLHGNTAGVPDDKKAYLEIYFTDPNN